MRSGLTPCWLWKASTQQAGYGQFHMEGKQRLAHRVAFEFWYGRTPSKQACHTCDNRICVNPHHLFEGSAKENMQDALAKGRMKPCFAHRPKGEKSHLSKLTAGKVMEIRALRKDGFSLNQLARNFGVSRGCIEGVIHRRNWKHLAE